MTERLMPDAQLQKESALFLNFLSSRTASTWSFDSALFPSHKLDVPHFLRSNKLSKRIDWKDRLQFVNFPLLAPRHSQLAKYPVPNLNRR